MGTTCMEKPANVKQYLDSLLTWENQDGKRVVLDSAICNFKTYYAAVQHTKPDGTIEVWAAVTLLSYHGSEFCYKDMCETMGPTESTCPARILDLLTPTDHEYAIAWRERCRANASKPKVGHGDTVKFPFEYHFSNGYKCDTFKAEKHGRAIRFRSPAGTLCNLRGWRNAGFQIVASN